MTAPDLCFLTAAELGRRLKARELSAVEVMEAHLTQIERLNAQVNAFCTLIPEQALCAAEAADTSLARGGIAGPLHGLPVGIKDLVDTRGIRTTYGSPIYRDHVPEQDALIVERYRSAGAIVVGKTNTPEFGAGAQTFNTLFGETHNPYDLAKTCGGSSGGSAVALACGMVPLASGSDLGGSLRNPASFCNVVGFRPSLGRVPTWPVSTAWSSLSVQGPMARVVEDVALQLSVLAGPDPRSPIAIREAGSLFAAPLERDFRGARIAWSRDLSRYPVDSAVTAVCDRQRPVFEELGCLLDEAAPDLSDVDEIFQVLRAWAFAGQYEQAYREHRDLLKDTVVWNIEQGLSLDALTVAQAEIKRSQLYDRVRRFFERYEFLVLPAVSVPPFPIGQRYVSEINGQPLGTYIDWLGLTYAITVTGLPAISVPAGFTADGLPVGLQIVGRHQADFAVLQLAHAFEAATQVGAIRPAIVA